MAYENISKLVDEIHNSIDKTRYWWSGSDGEMQRQDGIIRTNCIDCVDRTNVAQSAFAKHVLNAQLTQNGILPQDLPALDTRFNEVWANNGDYISVGYSKSPRFASLVLMLIANNSRNSCIEERLRTDR